MHQLPQFFRSPIFLWTCIAAAAIALRIPGLLESLWFDEVYRTFVVLSGERAADVIWRDVHNPLYNTFMYGWIRVFGDSEVAIRIPTLLAALASAWILHRWARASLGPLPAGLCAAWMLLSPVPIWYSVEAKNTMFTVLFTTLALWRLDRLLAERTLPAALYAGVAFALAIWTDFQPLLGLIPACIAAWIVLMRVPEHRPAATLNHGVLGRTGPLCIAVAVAVVLTLPLIIFKSQRLSDLPRDYLKYFHTSDALRLLFVYFPTGNALAWNTHTDWWRAALLVAVPLLPMLVLGWRMLWSERRSIPVLAAFLWPMLLLAAASEAAVLLDSPHRFYQERNLIIMLPAFAFIVFAGASATRWARLAAYSLCVLALASSVLMVTLRAREATVTYPNPDWRSAAALMIRTGGENPLVISKTPLLPLVYYARSDPREPATRLAIAQQPRERHINESIAAELALHNRDAVFVVTNPRWNAIESLELAEMLGRYPPLAITHVDGLTIYHLSSGQRLSR